jgi:hypothetical protein
MQHLHCHNLSQKTPQLDNLSSREVRGNGFTRITVCPAQRHWDASAGEVTSHESAKGASGIEHLATQAMNLPAFSVLLG